MHKLHELTQDRIWNIFEKNFRSMIIGTSGVGKSFFLTQVILPVIQQRYDRVIIFTRPTNLEYYKRQTWDWKANKELRNYKEPLFGEPKPPERYVYISTNQDEFLPIIKNIPKLQTEVITSYDNEGNPTYKYRVLLIFDDILDEKFNKSQPIIDLFTHYRHYNVDAFFIIQTATRQIPTIMSNNTNVYILGGMNMANMRDRCLDGPVKDVIKTTDMQDAKAKMIVRNVYKRVCENHEHGILLIDIRNNSLYFHINEVDPRDVRGYEPPKIKQSTWYDKYLGN